MWNEIKKYNWGHLLSDLVVAILATILTFLLDKIKSLDVSTLPPVAGGIVGILTNNLKRIFC